MSGNLQIVCPNCAAINRLPAERLNNKPRCGKCQKPLFSGEPLELTDDTFQKVVHLSSLPVLVLFWAPWCGYCRKTLPDFKLATKTLEPRYRTAMINTEEYPTVAGNHGINSLPTLILFKNGQERTKHHGAMDVNQIINWTRSVGL